MTPEQAEEYFWTIPNPEPRRTGLWISFLRFIGIED